MAVRMATVTGYRRSGHSLAVDTAERDVILVLKDDVPMLTGSNGNDRVEVGTLGQSYHDVSSIRSTSVTDPAQHPPRPQYWQVTSK